MPLKPASHFPSPAALAQLPAPKTHSRAAAKTHQPTDEAALVQLAPLSPLPALVLQFRALQNFVSKWVNAEWARAASGGHGSAEAYAAATAAAGAPDGCGGLPRVHCWWNQTQTATGRLSSSNPNLQVHVRLLAA